MEHPKAIGDRSTLAVMLALFESGYDIYLPFGENTRCDLIIDRSDSLQRVQCKTARVRNGALVFKVCSSYAHHRNPRERFRSYQGDVDAFGVYCPATKGVYLVPMEDIRSNFEAVLRMTPPLNNQRVGVRFAADYLVRQVGVSGTTGGLRGRAGAGGSSA